MPPENRDAPRDPTPEVGAQTDIAPLGRSGPKPSHERTADEEADLADWAAIAQSNKFKELLRAKRRFIVPATIFFILYYFALPYLVGYHPELMRRKVWGEMNLAYLFALSQFFVAWIIAGLYVRAAAKFDRMAAETIEGAGK